MIACVLPEPHTAFISLLPVMLFVSDHFMKSLIFSALCPHSDVQGTITVPKITKTSSGMLISGRLLMSKIV